MTSYKYNLLALVHCLLLTSCHTASITQKAVTQNQQNVTETSTVMYNGTHDTVGGVSVLTTPQKLDQSDKDGSKVEEKSLQKTIFSLETAINANGDRVDQGLFVLKDGIKTKLLDNAIDIAVVSLTNPVFFVAKDGIYVYNALQNKLEKYESVKLNDEIISIAVENSTGVIYYLNKQHQLYKVTEQGNKRTIIDEAKNAQDIVIDNIGHLYYYDEDKKFYVYDGSHVKIVKNVPENMAIVKFVKERVFREEAVFYDDEMVYIISGANATARVLWEPPFKGIPWHVTWL